MRTERALLLATLAAAFANCSGLALSSVALRAAHRAPHRAAARAAAPGEAERRERLQQLFGADAARIADATRSAPAPARCA